MIIETPEKVDILSVGCIIIFSNKYLLLHRKKDDLWNSLVGKFEDEDMSINAAIKREILEEVGLNIEPKFFSITYHKLNDRNVAYYIFEYEFENDPSEIIKLNNEHDKFGFFTFEEVLKLKLFEDEDYILKLFKETKRKNGL